MLGATAIIRLLFVAALLLQGSIGFPQNEGGEEIEESENLTTTTPGAPELEKDYIDLADFIVNVSLKTVIKLGSKNVG